MADVELRKLEREFLETNSEVTRVRLVSAYKKAGMFAIEETLTDYILYNVEHVRIVNNEPVRDVSVNIKLSKNLLDNGKRHTQADWIKIAKKRRIRTA